MDSQNGKAQASLGDESNILERVARLISSVRGAKPDYAHLAAELEPALPFDLFGIVLLRHDRAAVRVTACQKEGGSWMASYHQLPLADSMAERMLMALLPQKRLSTDRHQHTLCHRISERQLMIAERMLMALLPQKRLSTDREQWKLETGSAGYAPSAY